MYGKIFERMFTGTMYGSGPVVFSVWAYVIASTKPPGVVSLNQKLLAATIGCSTEEIREAIEFLMRPDPESATTDEDGRRLVHVSGLDYHVVSWQKYRDLRDEESRREYMRDYMRKRRAGKPNSDLQEPNKVNRKQSKQRKPDGNASRDDDENRGRDEQESSSRQELTQYELKPENQDHTPLDANGKRALAKLAKAEAEAYTIPLLKRRARVDSAAFVRFWTEYPRKRGRADAAKAFEALAPDDEMLRVMLAAVKQDAKSEQWRRDGGQFIPYPARWLRSRRWEDGEDQPAQPGKSGPAWLHDGSLGPII